ncbi:hypothetical protein TRFO_26411 [Tritrichomonas foetus]|uniref:C2 domain-containing protein n=1 Tax=Tritrichomonas foetus TaxID=1144522 RepID=A0A1J4K3P1_9EUKA|nr:hypothetical protein TRFO_26411 [Tritrichomonas foetus]|eukprot:OHT05803.1 hypothetical protein TRFO_26411 [Tritrichomonas foetus]
MVRNPKRTIVFFCMSRRADVDEMSNKLRQIVQELKNSDVSAGGFDMSASLSDYSDFSDDKLSCVSDISSVASFELTPLKDNFKNYRNAKQNSKKTNRNIPKQSRIPVPAKSKRSDRGSSSSNGSSRNSSGFRLAKPIKCPSPPPVVEVPMNFLAPDLSDYSHACLCVFEGTDFPRSRNGERSTYVVVQLHPDLPPVRSPICFNRTTNAVYNGGFDLNCIGINFSSVVPVVEVFDFISEDQNELLGMAFLQLHMARRVDDVCVVLQDEWIDVFTVNTRIKCGRIKMTLVFHNETDISQFVNRETLKTHPQVSKQQKQQKVEEDKPVLESISVQAVNEPRVENNTLMDNIGELDLSFNYANKAPYVKPNNYVNSGNAYNVQSTPFNNNWNNINQLDSPAAPEKVRINPFQFGPVRRAPIIIKDDEKDDIPVKLPKKPDNYNDYEKIERKPEVIKKVEKPEMVFVDECDLSALSDDIFSNSASSSSSAISSSRVITREHKQVDRRTRVPLQPQQGNIIQRITPEANKPQLQQQPQQQPNDIQQQKRRFARYSDFNWH